MEGWVDLGYSAMHRPGTKLATSRSRVRRLTTTLTEQPTYDSNINDAISVLLQFWYYFYTYHCEYDDDNDSCVLCCAIHSSSAVLCSDTLWYSPSISCRVLFNWTWFFNSCLCLVCSRRWRSLSLAARMFAKSTWCTAITQLSTFLIIMSPLRRHIFVCFIAKSAFWVFFRP